MKKATVKRNKKNLWIVLLSIIIVLLLGILFCFFYQSQTRSQQTTTYEGTLPCADCSGIIETLSIMKPYAFLNNGTYVMHDFYEGKSTPPYITQGTWEITQGMPGNPQANILVLTPQNAQTKTYYLMIDKQTLEPLDSNKKRINSPFDQNLREIGMNNKPSPASSAGMRNPASVNCVNKGGTLVIKKRGDGGEYGLCQFEDNQACEEWALYRGECPVGGVKTTGFDNIQQNYCAWTGGQTYAVPNAKCTLPNGHVCSDNDLYNGTCN